MSLSAYWFIYQWILTTKLSDCKVILGCVFEAGLLNFQAYILPCSLLLHAICVLYQIWPFILQCYFWSLLYQMSPAHLN